jgi:hypothetical protein
MIARIVSLVFAIVLLSCPRSLAQSHGPLDVTIPDINITTEVDEFPMHVSQAFSRQAISAALSSRSAQGFELVGTLIATVGNESNFSKGANPLDTRQNQVNEANSSILLFWKKTNRSVRDAELMRVAQVVRDTVWRINDDIMKAISHMRDLPQRASDYDQLRNELKDKYGEILTRLERLTTDVEVLRPHN